MRNESEDLIGKIRSQIPRKVMGERKVPETTRDLLVKNGIPLPGQLGHNAAVEAEIESQKNNPALQQIKRNLEPYPSDEPQRDQK